MAGGAIHGWHMGRPGDEFFARPTRVLWCTKYPQAGIPDRILTES